MKLIFGDDHLIRDWVSKELFKEKGHFDDMCPAIGVLLNEEIIAGVIYSNYQKKSDGSGLSIEMSIASINKRWCTKNNLRTFFSYPFTQLGLRRVQTTCSANESEIIAFNKRLGFVHEGTHRDAWPMGGDALSWSMLNNECKWS